MLHPKWGSGVYPATIFTTAPLHVLLPSVSETEAEAQGEAEADVTPPFLLQVVAAMLPYEHSFMSS